MRTRTTWRTRGAARVTSSGGVLPSRRARALAGCAATVCILVAGCGGGSTQAGSTRSTTLVVGTTGALSTVDPVHAESYAGNQIDSALYERLVEYDANNAVVPSLAVDFAVAPDASSIRFTLPADGKFHDGTALTAADVAYTLDRIKKIGQGVAGFVSSYASTEVLSDTSFRIVLSRPDSSFLGALSKVWIVNKKLVEANAGTNDGQAWLQSHDAGSGPFRMDPATPAKEIAVTRFAEYRKADPARPAGIRFKQIDVSATLRDSVKSGAIDIATNLSAGDAKMLEGDPALEVVTVPQLVMTVVWLNVDSGPTANPVVRKALQLAYDYTGGLDSIRLGYGHVADGVAPDGFGCRPTLPAAHQDLAAARKLLDDAGIHDLALTMRYQPLSTEQTREATLLQSNLKAIGVTLDLVPITFPDWLSSLTKKETIPSMMLVGDSAQYPDLGTWLSTQYLSSAIGTTNRTGYANPQVDTLIQQGLGAADSAAACTAYQRAQELLAADSPAIFMYSTFAPMVYRKGLTGMTPKFTVRPVDFADVRLAG